MANLPPAEKLPLAVRKNVRDSWENKKGEFETEISTMLGTPWTFDINPLAIFPYAEEGSYGNRSLGDCITSYISGAIYQLKRYVESHAESGKQELNSVCTAHVVTLTASTAFSYCGCDIQSGQLRLLFNPKCLGTNVDQAASDLADAVSKAPQPSGAPALSFAARHAIQTGYDPTIGEVLEKASKMLQLPALKFEPDFESLGKMLKSGKDVRDDWERNLGDFAKRYYESFLSALEKDKFGEDEMLREGFEEGVPKGVVRLRLVEKLKSGYNEILIDDGELIIQTTPSNWGTNIDYAASNLLDIL